jgi:predicted metal-dependent enzyme (double-stranded beta helix superfamily)
VTSMNPSQIIVSARKPRVYAICPARRSGAERGSTSGMASFPAFDIIMEPCLNHPNEETMVSRMETTPPSKNDALLPESLQTIVRAVQSSQALTPSTLRRIVREANIDPDDLMPWSAFDHSPADSYGRRLLYDGGFFEMMVMSWCPGDVSAIHDHGHTQWGAVQIFGPAEHAVFWVQNGEIKTLSRTNVKLGQIVYVGHDLVHQMGNRTKDARFLSFHLYGNHQRDHAITADAQLFDLNEGCIQRVDWGVFQALPEHDITRREKAPEPDFLTWLRNTVEIIRRVRTARRHHCDESDKDLDKLIADLFDKERKQQLRLLDDLSEQIDESGHAINGYAWKLLCRELGEAAALQDKVLQTQLDDDSFSSYAELYDAVIGNPCLEEFIAPYLAFCRKHYDLDFGDSTLLSLGCGTGLMERYRHRTRFEAGESARNRHFRSDDQSGAPPHRCRDR